MPDFTCSSKKNPILLSFEVEAKLLRDIIIIGFIETKKSAAKTSRKGSKMVTQAQHTIPCSQEKMELKILTLTKRYVPLRLWFFALFNNKMLVMLPFSKCFNLRGDSNFFTY